MYAVIRTGGKQYRVAPGDVIKVEKLAPAEGDFQFNDVLAVSSDEGKVTKPSGDAVVSARVLGEGRGDKILVFHYKRKKQYKKLQGHRQAFTAVQITEINVDGQRFKADESKLRQPAKPKAEAAAAARPAKKKAAKKVAKKAAPKKAAKKAAPKKK
jgi:large subunit ribosomal protein L21